MSARANQAATQGSPGRSDQGGLKNFRLDQNNGTHLVGNF